MSRQVVRWPEDKTIRFVQLYRHLECLWNVNHPDYKNKHARILGLEQLVAGMGIPGFTVKDAHKKIRSLRSTFVQEVKKISESIQNGAAHDQVHKPSLVWFDEMDYVMKASAMTDKDPISVSTSDQQLQLEFKQEPDIYVNEVVVEEAVETSPLSPCENVNSAPNSISRKRRKRNQHQATTTVHELSPVQLMPATPEDECDVIARHIGIQLRQLSTQDMLQANVEIQQVLLKYRLANLDRQQTDTSINDHESMVYRLH